MTQELGFLCVAEYAEQNTCIKPRLLKEWFTIRPVIMVSISVRRRIKF